MHFIDFDNKTVLGNMRKCEQKNLFVVVDETKFNILKLASFWNCDISRGDIQNWPTGVNLRFTELLKTFLELFTKLRTGHMSVKHFWYLNLFY